MVLALLPPTFRGTMHAVLPEQSIRSKTDIPGDRCGVDGFNRDDSFVSGRLLKPPEGGLEPFWRRGRQVFGLNRGKERIVFGVIASNRLGVIILNLLCGFPVTVSIFMGFSKVRLMFKLFPPRRCNGVVGMVLPLRGVSRLLCRRWVITTSTLFAVFLSYL